MPKSTPVDILWGLFSAKIKPVDILRGRFLPKSTPVDILWGLFSAKIKPVDILRGRFLPKSTPVDILWGRFSTKSKPVDILWGQFSTKSRPVDILWGRFSPKSTPVDILRGQQQRRPPTPPRQQKRTLLPGSFYQGGRIVQNQYGIDGRDSFSFTSRVCQHRRFPRLAVKPDALYLKIRTMRFSRLVSQHYSPSVPNCQKAYRRSRARRRLISLFSAS